MSEVTDVPPPATETPKTPRRQGLAHWTALARTVVYSTVATTYFLVTTLTLSFVLLLPAERTRRLFILWARGDLFLLRLICGQSVRVLGSPNIPDGAALIASKHQSAWETLAFIPLLPKGAVILKRELLSIPIYGWFARHYGMIPVDRAAGPKALRRLAVDAEGARREGHQIVIFPEGTRQSLGAAPDYKPGAIFLYERLKVPMVPVALNSGRLWPKGRFVRYPGTITVSFLPPIPPGMPRAKVRERLESAIEAETARLIAHPD